jgi:hypothetical protein
MSGSGLEPALLAPEELDERLPSAGFASPG